MDAGVPILATVTSTETGEFDAALSHLTLTTAFIETMHSAEFGDTLIIAVSDLVVKAEVVFVADAPMGWVVRFDACVELLKRTGQSIEPEMIEAPLDLIEPLPLDAISIDLPELEIEDPVTFNPSPNLWGEPTPTFEGPPKIANRKA